MDSPFILDCFKNKTDAGVKNDKFALVSKMNTRCNIAVKTPVGISDRFQLKEIEMQGTKLSNIKCAVQMDTLGKECYARSEGLFLYKECVYVPPLGMIDDLASFTECGADSVKVNALINAKIESKKLEFGPKKCFNIHIGQKNGDCLDQKVHDNVINVTSYETYLGDIVCSSGSNDRNINNRYNQGIGSVSQIVTILNQVSLGHYHYEIGLVLRDTILVSKLVSSSEVWYNLTKKQVSKLEKVDEMFFRNLFSLAKSAPKEGMFIECGKMPIRFVIIMRRIMFYWSVLHRDENELLHKFLTAQQLSTSKTDWMQQVRKNISDLQLNLSDSEIANMPKEQFKSRLKQKTEILAVKFLKKQQHSHSKTNQLTIKNFTPSEYLLSKDLKKEEVQILYKLRNRMIDVKCNMKSFYTQNLWCRTCYLFPESQEHLMQCITLVDKLKDNTCFQTLEYNMIFGKLQDQVRIAKYYTTILKTRLDVLEV